MATSTTSTTSGSGGVLQSLGVGSGIDVNSLVTQLVASEIQPDNNRIARQTTRVATQLSAVGQLKGALATFQTALNSLNTQADFQVKSVTSADEKIFTTSADSTAAAGIYQVRVETLATAQQLRSTAISGDGSAVVGTGNLNLTLGDKKFTIKIADDHGKLTEIRDAINSASDNPGISATIVHGSSTSQLVLTSSLTGAANTITITTDGGDGGLSALTYGPGNTANFTELKAAGDAAIKVAGVDFTSAKNSVKGAIDGVTLNLLDTKPGTDIAVTVTNDTSAVTNRIQSFVTAYNTLRSVVAKLGNYDAASQTAGPLLGDAILENITAQVRRVLSSPVSSVDGSVNTLAALGITTNRDGSLSLDTTKVSAALSDRFNVVSQIFGGTDGVATKLSKFIDAQLAANAGIASRNKTLADQQKQITTQQAVIAARKQKITDRYTAQFTAMDKALAKMQSTSTFLTQQLDNIAKMLNSSNK